MIMKRAAGQWGPGGPAEIKDCEDRGAAGVRDPVSSSGGLADVSLWQEAVAPLSEIYGNYHHHPFFAELGLREGMRRSLSVPAHVASRRPGHEDAAFFRYLCVAREDAASLHVFLLLANHMGYLAREEVERGQEAASALYFMVSALLHEIRHGSPEGRI